MFWKLVFQVQILKVGVPDVGFKACAALGEAQGFEFPLDVGSLSWEWGLLQYCVSASPTYFVVGFFPFAWYIGVTQLVLEFFFFWKKLFCM